MMLWPPCKRIAPLALIFAFAALFLSGCGGDSKPRPTEPPENFISRANGGTVTLEEQVTVTVPPEAISEDAELQIELAETYPALPEGYGLASPVYEILLSAGQVTDTVWITVTYLEGLLPGGLLEGDLLIGYTDGQNWVLNDPEVQPGENHARTGALNVGTWAVIWKAQHPKQVVSALLSGVIEDISQGHRADFELVLGAGDVADFVASLQEYKSSLDAAAADDPTVESAVMNFLEANRAIENDGNLVVFSTAAELAGSFIELGLATGYYADNPSTYPPQVRMGSRRLYPPAFVGLFKNHPGYKCVWASGKAGCLRNADSVQHDFFVLLNGRPTFGGLTYLDPPPEIQRGARILSRQAVGTSRVHMLRGTTATNKTIYYDYFRNRGITLYWPLEGDVIMFNLLASDHAVTAVAYAIEFDDLLVDFQVVHENPFAQDVESDTLGTWIYFGLPNLPLVDLHKQGGHLTFASQSAGAVERDDFVFPVNWRAFLDYGDWTPPAAIEDLRVVEYRGNFVDLRWSAPGNDLDSGTATTYDLRYSTSPIDEVTWGQAFPLAGEPAPAEPPALQGILLFPFDLSETIYLAIKTLDQDFNVSPLSNVLQLYNLSELVVDFPDANLEQTVRGMIDRPSGNVYAADVAGVTEFSAIGKGIVVLQGIEFVYNVTALDLLSNLLIRDLSPLDHLINLRWLRLAVNDLHDISPLSMLRDLRMLDLGSNNISDISPLGSLVKLDSLSIPYNLVADVQPLAGLRNLRYLNLGANRLSDLSGLQYLENMVTLLLDRNEIEDLTPLLDNPGLGYGDTLDVRENLLSDGALEAQIPLLQARGAVVLFDPPEE